MQTATHTPIALSDLFSVKDFTERHSGILSKTTLQWQLRQRDTNGLSSACVRIGRRVLISESRYEQWLSTQSVGG